MPSVSRTLWSVISTPMLRCFRNLHDLLDFEHGDRIDARERFVEQDKARIGRQRAGDFHPTPFAARQRQRRILAQMRDLQFVQQRFRALRDRVLARAACRFRPSAVPAPRECSARR